MIENSTTIMYLYTGFFHFDDTYDIKPKVYIL